MCTVVLLGVVLFYSYVVSTSNSNSDLPINYIPVHADSATLGAIGLKIQSNTLSTWRAPSPSNRYTYRVIRSFPHDPQAFTQGLQIVGGEVFEGTGLNGRSVLRQVDLKTGRMVREFKLEDKYFGEGIVVFKNMIYQITWQNHVGFVYHKDAHPWRVVKTWNYRWEGWGLTHNGTHILMSDGTDVIHFLDPDTLEEVHRISIRDGRNVVKHLNELEFIDGELYANVWLTNNIAIINPETGKVNAWIDLDRILTPQDAQNHQVDVLNGIAFDEVERTLYVTGKLWPKLYQIELVPIQEKRRRK